MLSEQAKEARRRYHANYREANRERIRENQKRWQQENPEKRSETLDRYWEKKALATGPRCQHCGDPFQAKRSDAKFCSARCRVAYSRKR